MSTTERPMPDFADALEQHLRHAAAEAAAGRLTVSPLPASVAPHAPTTDRSGGDATADRPGRRHDGSTTDRDGRRKRRRSPAAGSRPLRIGRPVAALGSATLVAVLVVVLLVAGGSGPGTGRAYGAPLALRTPLVVLPEYARSQSSARNILGPDGPKITRGHAVPLQDGSTAYVYGNADGYCLWAPDPTFSDPREGGGVTCVRTAQFLRFGIVLGMGTDSQGTIIAALPQGVRNPVVSRQGQADRSLTPSSDGVVVLSTIVPTTITFFDRAGRQQIMTLATPYTGANPVRANPLRTGFPGVVLPGTPPEQPVPVEPDFSVIPPPGYPLPKIEDFLQPGAPPEPSGSGGASP
jgi:hypothetical protein